MVRAVQDERKAAGLHISDRIDLTLGVPAEHTADAVTWSEFIAHETLALSTTLEEAPKLSVRVARRG